MKLLSDRILVKIQKAEEKNSFGIILPEQQKNKDLGLVVSVGPKVQYIKVGDTVQKFTHSQGTPIDIEGVDHIFLKESTDIELVIEK